MHDNIKISEKLYTKLRKEKCKINSARKLDIFLIGRTMEEAIVDSDKKLQETIEWIQDPMGENILIEDLGIISEFRK